MELTLYINFSDFSASFLTLENNDIETQSVVSQFGDDWKRVRSTISPMFTSSKMRAMSEKLPSSIAKLRNVLDRYAKDGSDFTPEKWYSLMVMEVVSKSLYSLDIDVYKQENDAIVRSGKAFFEK